MAERTEAELPALVGATVAAEILGIQPTHLGRLRRRGRLPNPVRVEGGHDAYVRSEIEKLGRELGRERARRAERRESDG